MSEASHADLVAWGQRSDALAHGLAAHPDVTVVRYEAVWDVAAYSVTRPWCVKIETVEHAAFIANGATEGEAMLGAFALMPG